MVQSRPIFLSHNSLDKPVVEAFAHAMKDAGLVPWFDKWDLSQGVGRPWQPKLVEGIHRCPIVWVFVGEHGPGRWQDVEVQKAMNDAIRDPERLVVPIVLARGDLREWGFVDVFMGVPTNLTAEPPAGENAHREWLSAIRSVVDGLVIRMQSHAKGARSSDARGEASLELDAAEPYRGLRAFTEGDAAWMFGREDEVQILIARLRRGERFLCVTGASGSGKSSVVCAGLVPAVKTGQLDGDYAWRSIILRPGSEPCRMLARAIGSLRLDRGLTDAERSEEVTWNMLALKKDPNALRELAAVALNRLPDNPRLLLVVDQFEELFTQTYDVAERFVFIENLLRATTETTGYVTVVTTLRADFIGECLNVPGLDARLERSLRMVMPPMKSHQLFEAIVRPAARLGVQVEASVRDDLLKETVGQTGQLPLLQFALSELWKERKGDLLTYEVYKTFGGIRGAIAKTADRVLHEMSEAEREAALRLLGRLVSPGVGAADTRRKANRSEMGNNPLQISVLNRLDAHRLITIDEHTVEIAHEVLIQEWEALQKVLQERREAMPVELELVRDSQTWRMKGRSAEELWTGGRLRRATDLDRQGQLYLNPDERNFLEASRASARRRLWMTRTVIVATVFLVCAVPVTAGVLKLKVAEAEATHRRNLAEQKREAAEADAAHQRNLAEEKQRAADEIALKERAATAALHSAGCALFACGKEAWKCSEAITMAIQLCEPSEPERPTLISTASGYLESAAKWWNLACGVEGEPRLRARTSLDTMCRETSESDIRAQFCDARHKCDRTGIELFTCEQSLEVTE